MIIWKQFDLQMPILNTNDLNTIIWFQVVILINTNHFQIDIFDPQIRV